MIFIFSVFKSNLVKNDFAYQIGRVCDGFFSPSSENDDGGRSLKGVNCQAHNLGYILACKYITSLKPTKFVASHLYFLSHFSLGPHFTSIPPPPPPQSLATPAACSPNHPPALLLWPWEFLSCNPDSKTSTTSTTTHGLWWLTSFC
jgi:hypothetical protein